ncbi:unnamed protein product [Sphagnum balticum]
MRHAKRIHRGSRPFTCQQDPSLDPAALSSLDPIALHSLDPDALNPLNPRIPPPAIARSGRLRDFLGRESQRYSESGESLDIMRKNRP